MYNDLGQYDYNGETYIDDIEDKVGKIDWSKYYYVGQFKNNSKIPDGIGITVWNSGDTFFIYSFIYVSMKDITEMEWWVEMEDI